MTEHLYVTFEDTGRKLAVVRACNRCYGRAVAVSELETIEIVSRYGTAHKAGSDLMAASTDCGIDATGEQWWWRG